MQELRNKIKYKGIKRYVYSTKYSIEGLIYSYKNEKSVDLHAILSIITIVLGFILKISLTQWAVVLITLGVVLAIELLNTAIEAVVDMVTLEYHPLAKVAKDCGSAATFTLTMIGIVIICVIYVPKVIELIEHI